MIYITDSFKGANKDRVRPANVSHIKSEPTVIAPLGNDFFVRDLHDRDDLPNWQKFSITQEADAEMVKGMIHECQHHPELNRLCLEGLKMAVPPLSMAKD